MFGTALAARRLTLLTTLVFGLLGPLGTKTSWAQGKARRPSEAKHVPSHHEVGERLFAEGRYEQAVAEFRKAYELEARPEFLLQIGRSYERIGHSDKARYFFQRYLSTAPSDAPARPEVEALMASAPPPPATEPTAPDDLVMVPLEYEASKTAADVPPSRLGGWWLWIGAGAAVLAGVGIALALSNGGDDVPRSDLGHQRFF